MNKWLNTLSKTFTFRLLNCHYRRSLPLCQNFSLKKSLTHNQVRFFKMSDLDNLPPVDPKTGEVIINPLKEDGSPKTPKEIEKEKKKAEKLLKFAAKQAKKNAAATTGASQKKPKKKKEVEPIPEFIDKTVPGEKKILVSLDDPALKAYNPANVESSWYDWWIKTGVFEPEFTADGKVKPEGVFCIPAPPPNVTGALHIGHALTIAIQDSLIRYNRMKGKTVLFLPGFDHAGIATQSVVEKQIWAKDKKTRHDYGREAFIGKVWEWKEEYHGRIKNQIQKLGASYDWSREAFTLSPELTKSVEEAFVRLHDEGVIYRASRLVNWSVKLNTAISNLEVENKDVKSRTLLSVPGYDEKVEFGVLTSFAYPVIGSDEKLIIATTRPETIFGDTAVAVHPDDDRYKHLHGKFIQHPFLPRKIPIITDKEAVDMEFGTGAVKITPAHDQNDYNTGKRHNLEFINILTDDGLLNEECGPEWQGMKRFDARKKVIEQLKEKNLYVGQEDNEMTIPTCSRSGDIIEPLLKPQWWVSQSEMAKDAIKVVKDGQITITPKSSEAEYFHWLGNIQDWCISRQLWWGHRCPVYFINIEGEEHDRIDGDYWVAGRSMEEAEKKAAAKYPNSKFTLEQDEDVLDTWFSSGLWPFSTLGWPEKTKDMETFYPFSMLETGWDILFFWVTRMILLGLKLTGSVPFKEVFCHSLVRDAQGRKMSKSLGNVIDPLDVITGIKLDDLHAKLLQGNLDPREVEKAKIGQKESYPNGIPQCGTDAMRFALCAYTTGGRDINLDILRVEGYRKFCNKIYQATKFALMRLGDDYQPPATEGLSGNESLVEKWILHKLTETSKIVNEALDKRDFLTSTSSIYEFWYLICDVYIENSKYLIQEGSAIEKKSAKDTLYILLDNALKLIHPFMPFISEEMWQRLPKRSTEKAASIVKASYPVYVSEYDDVKSANAYDLVLNITKEARSLLSEYNILKNGKVFVESNHEEYFKTAEDQKDSIVSLIKAIDEVTVVRDASEIPEGCVLQSVNPEVNVHLLVKGHVDIDAEIAKVQKKLEKAKKSKNGIEQTINSKDYETKANAQAKEANKSKLDNTVAEIEGLEATIENLKRLKL
ncbi:XXYS1_4_G0036300.mRNA.1.CDS.1 [Saccharomyces cerevisiae]|nr:EM14S01-3B_G0033730.mRNA.1.CDS.1 [Saccharomyces cerevisiae]CAD6626367.1 XXYS1_4_G0036300.mRNA.1.CDS.1 [Saccharomyces cerevisiae]CAI4480991.1 AMH_1a_G0020740.mRNA.1.CDS.1 [Saccharomyces cerevisiae]CAI4492680.1 CEI_1a_G0020660.mRNA.1.CDS.1 [Saccharomyces cerevisiae]CAI6677855.1 AMH_1a_G0020740.mRNA.1.CDS.1 [Saccharomyces cerevisiae]